MSEREDLGLVALTSDERIVAGNRAVVAEPQDLAGMAVRILRAVALASTGRHVERAVASERDAGGTATPSGAHKDVSNVSQFGPGPHATRERNGSLVVIEWLGVGEIDEVVLRKLRMKRDVHQTS